MAVEIKVPTIDGLTLKTKNKYVEEDIAVTIGIPHYDGDGENIELVGTLNIVENGEYNVLKYEKVNVEVPNKLQQLFNKTITSVSAEEIQGITEVYPKLFYNCKLLESVDLPDTVSIIGEQSFTNCSLLKEIKIPEGVTTIPTMTFRNCTSLEKVTFPTSITTVGADAFELNTKTKELCISDFVAYLKIAYEDLGANPISSNAGSYSTILIDGEAAVNVIIPSGVKLINKYTLYKVITMESLYVTNGVTKIERYSIARNPNLRTLHLPNTLTSVDDTAFDGCTALENVTFEDGFNCPINLSYSTLYSVETIVAMLEALATITTTKRLTLGSTNLKKLSSEQKKIATNKGWTLV